MDKVIYLHMLSANTKSSSSMNDILNKTHTSSFHDFCKECGAARDQSASRMFVDVPMSTLHEYYSRHHKVYTDSSETASLTGCGICVEQLNIRQSITINSNASSFSAELFGILRALYCVFIYASGSQSGRYLTLGGGEAEMGGWGAIGDPVNNYISVVLLTLSDQTS